MKKINLLAMLLALCLLLTACGGAAKSEAAYDQMASAEEAPAAEPEAPAEEWAEEESGTVYQFATTDSASDSGGAMTVEQVKDFSDKIIYSGNVYMETTKFDEAIASLDQAIKEYGGFVQDSIVNGDTQYHDDGTTTVINRWGYYTVRVPASKFDAFMALTGQIGNVTSSSRTAENVTSQYTDYEARLTSLYTQEERLLAMLEKSEDVESLIELESRLSEVRYEIESIERNLRDLDQRLSYSTVTLEIREVEIYTPTKSVQRTFGEKIADAFSDGWRGFSRGLQNLAVTLVYGMPTILLLLAIAAVVAVVARKVVKKRNAKKAAKAEKQEET